MNPLVELPDSIFEKIQCSPVFATECCYSNSKLMSAGNMETAGEGKIQAVLVA